MNFSGGLISTFKLSCIFGCCPLHKKGRETDIITLRMVKTGRLQRFNLLARAQRSSEKNVCAVKYLVARVYSHCSTATLIYVHQMGVWFWMQFCAHPQKNFWHSSVLQAILALSFPTLMLACSSLLMVEIPGGRYDLQREGKNRAFCCSWSSFSDGVEHSCSICFADLRGGV